MSQAISEQLEARKLQTDIPVAAQIRRAIEDYVTIPVDNSHRLLTTRREALIPALIPNRLWDELKVRKVETGLDLNEQVQIAVALYLQQEVAFGTPLTQSQSQSQSQHRGTSPADTDQWKRMINEELEARLAELGVTKGMPVRKGKTPKSEAPPKTGRLIYHKLEIADNEVGFVALRVLAQPPCGPWKEALEEADFYYISGDMAGILGVKPGDFLVTADGQSMEAAGIPDKSLVLMRPLNGKKPEFDAVVLVIVQTQDEQWLGTIKHWRTTDKGNPDLRDGRGLPYELPSNPKKVEAVAYKVGLIARG